MHGAIFSCFLVETIIICFIYKKPIVIVEHVENYISISIKIMEILLFMK